MTIEYDANNPPVFVAESVAFGVEALSAVTVEDAIAEVWDDDILINQVLDEGAHSIPVCLDQPKMWVATVLIHDHPLATQ